VPVKIRSPPNTSVLSITGRNDVAATFKTPMFNCVVSHARPFGCGWRDAGNEPEITHSAKISGSCCPPPRRTADVHQIQRAAVSNARHPLELVVCSRAVQLDDLRAIQGDAALAAMVPVLFAPEIIPSRVIGAAGERVAPAETPNAIDATTPPRVWPRPTSEFDHPPTHVKESCRIIAAKEDKRTLGNRTVAAQS